jgi:hypothetical protein
LRRFFRFGAVAACPGPNVALDDFGSWALAPIAATAT